MKINSLENLVGVKEVHGQKLIQEPIYSSSGMIDWEAMAKADTSDRKKLASAVIKSLKA